MRTRRATGIALKADLCSSEQFSKFIVESGCQSCEAADEHVWAQGMESSKQPLEMLLHLKLNRGERMSC